MGAAMTHVEGVVPDGRFLGHQPTSVVCVGPHPQ